MVTVIDPRIERTKRTVLDAAVHVVADRGFAGASIDAIAKRCGVARSTIYRHWPNRLDLLLEAVNAHVVAPEAHVTGELRADLITILARLAELLSAEPMGSVTASLILESRRDPSLDTLRKEFVAERRSAARGVIADAVARGELPETEAPQRLADDLAAAVLFRALILREPANQSWIEDLVDTHLGRSQSPPFPRGDQ